LFCKNKLDASDFIKFLSNTFFIAKTSKKFSVYLIIICFKFVLKALLFDSFLKKLFLEIFRFNQSSKFLFSAKEICLFPLIISRGKAFPPCSKKTSPGSPDS